MAEGKQMTKVCVIGGKLQGIEALYLAKKAGMVTMRLCHGKPNDKCNEYIDIAVDNINECLQYLEKEFCC